MCLERGLNLWRKIEFKASPSVRFFNKNYRWICGNSTFSNALILLPFILLLLFLDVNFVPDMKYRTNIWLTPTFCSRNSLLTLKNWLVLFSPYHPPHMMNNEIEFIDIVAIKGSKLTLVSNSYWMWDYYIYELMFLSNSPATELLNFATKFFTCVFLCSLHHTYNFLSRSKCSWAVDQKERKFQLHVDAVFVCMVMIVNLNILMR